MTIGDDPFREVFNRLEIPDFRPTKQISRSGTVI